MTSGKPLVAISNYENSALVRFVCARRALPTLTPGNIDESGFINGHVGLTSHMRESDVPRGAPFFVRGWAIDLGRKRLPWDIRIEIDGRETAARVSRDFVRPDIARRFSSAELLNSGFTGFVDTRRLSIGPHALRIRAVVGRYGTAFARIPSTIKFFVHSEIATVSGPPRELPIAQQACSLDPLPVVSTASVLALSGTALDGQGRALRRVAAQIDENRWNEGWVTGAQGGFNIRARLDTIAAGVHIVRVAGKTAAGQWIQLGTARPLTVTTEPAPLSPWVKPLVDGGVATVTDAQGRPQTRLELYRIRSGISILGDLRRMSPVGLPVALIARAVDGAEFSLAGWTTPTGDPHHILFGADVPERGLPPGIYRLVVDAPDRSHRFAGRADTNCDLVVARRPAFTTEDCA